MKKLIALFLSLMLIALPTLSLAEDGLILSVLPMLGIIGGADGPTALLVSDLPEGMPGTMVEKALQAGRRIHSETTMEGFSFGSTSNTETDAAIAELLNSLRIIDDTQGEEYSIRLALGDKELLTFGALLSGKDAYIHSNLLGGTVVIGEDDIQPLAERVLNLLVVMEVLTQEDVDALKEQLPTLTETLEQELSTAMFNLEDLLAMDFTALVEAIAPVLNKIQPVEPVAAENHDPAESAFELIITEEDAKAFLRGVMQVIHNNPTLWQLYARSYLTQEEQDEYWEMYKKYDVFESREDFNRVFPTAEDAYQQALADLINPAESTDVVTIHAELDKNGLPVAVTFTWPLYETVRTYSSTDTLLASEVLPGEQTLTYLRQTQPDEEKHLITLDKIRQDAETSTQPLTASLTLGEKGAVGHLLWAEGTSKSTVDFNLTWDFSDTKSAFDFWMDFGLEEMVAENADANELNDVTKFGIGLNSDYRRNGVDFTGTETIRVEYNGQGFSVVSQVSTADPLPSITTGEVVRPAELDETAFAQWAVGIINGGYTWLMEVITALPAGLVNLVGAL